jgi:ABC-type xylose transport system permease subunit
VIELTNAQAMVAIVTVLTIGYLIGVTTGWWCRGRV